MADSKITALASISTSTDPAVDPLVIVDVSDTSMAATGTTKKVTLNNLLSSSPTATGAFSVTGLVTAGSATITGDLTVDTSTLKVDSTNNRVGIGTASPTGIFHAANLGTAGTTADNFNGYFSSANRNSSVYILAKNTEGSNLYLGDGDSNTVGAVIYDHTSNYMRFDVNGAEAARFNSTANLVLKGGTAGATGVGLTFPATQVASSDANCLDDYEEGTWSPTPSGNVNLTSVVSVSARYTKVGRLVTLSGHVTATVTLPNIVTYFVLPSLPFANGTVTTGAVMENGNFTVGAIQVSASNLYGFFPVASAIVSGAATFYYSVTYSV